MDELKNILSQLTPDAVQTIAYQNVKKIFRITRFFASLLKIYYFQDVKFDYKLY